MLELDSLTKQFGATRALDGLPLTVRPGEVCGFVGQNGVGKTTAMRILLGVLEPDGGSVRWQGAPVDAAVRCSSGYIPEHTRRSEHKLLARHLRQVEQSTVAADDSHSGSRR